MFMSISLNLSTVKRDNGYGLVFSLTGRGDESQKLLKAPAPATLETWQAGDANGGRQTYSKGYDQVREATDGIRGECVITGADGAQYRVADVWRQVSSDTWQVDRRVKVESGSLATGVRSRLDFVTAFQEGAEFTDLRYFVPPILYDRNDLDEDGVEDYLETQNLMYREDRLNMLAAMAYHEKSQISMTLIRADVPEFDSLSDRKNKERVFLQKTDVGSLGFWGVPGKTFQMSLRACYPFYEGERSYALINEERPGWEVFWPAETGEILEVSYRIRVEEAAGFIKACWQAYSRMLKDLDPQPVSLPATPEDLVRYRLEALDRYYVDVDAATDPNEPAGFVVNCHPQDGKQLSDIIQYGFTGQNVLNAYNYLRYGYKVGDEEFIRKARRVIDFFVNKAHIKETGMFYNLYNADKQKMDFWWTGLLLPLAYAKPGESLEKLMGPIYYHWEDVIKELQKKQGSYLRCMSEDAHALLLAYECESQHGTCHSDWLEAAKRYGEFLLRTQESDGSWYRAYGLDGEKLTHPEIWFGTTRYEQKSSSGTPIPFLVKLYELTQDRRFLDAACKAGRFVRETLVDPVKCNGGIHDSMYVKGQLIDNEGVLYPMLGLLALYKGVGDDYYLQGAINAAWLFASWVCLWDVPLPPDSTLAKYGFRSTGMGACDTCGAGYVHPFQLIAVAELVELAEMTNDPALLDVAELIFHGCNQTVAVPGKDWGYKYTGLQEEGYLISWCWLDDPMFEDTAFGHRWKGEGNKTCFPWIPAVAVYGYWKMIDKYNTLDFAALRKELFSKQD